MKIRLRTLLVWLGIVSLAACPACDRRASRVRDALSPEEQALFDRGAQAAVECWSCHDFYSTQTVIGPGLLGVAGRRAASVEGFAYSDAMRRSGIVWTRRNLSAFLESPQTAIPGTSMVWRGVGDPEALFALVFYVEKITAP